MKKRGARVTAPRGICRCASYLPEQHSPSWRFWRHRGYAAACHMLRDGDTVIDGGCDDGHHILAMRGHVRNAHGVRIKAVGIDVCPTEKAFRYVTKQRDPAVRAERLANIVSALDPGYGGVTDADGLVELMARRRAELDEFVCAGIQEVDWMDSTADVVMCFGVHYAPPFGDCCRPEALLRLSGMLKTDGVAVLDVHRRSVVGGAARRVPRIHRMLRGPLRDWYVMARHALLDKCKMLRYALRESEVKTMSKSELADHARLCVDRGESEGNGCKHGAVVDFW